MTALADEEVTTAPTAEIVAYTGGGSVEEYRPRILMQPDEARALDESLRENMRSVLREDVDFGVIPGTGSKPTLLKPGAEKLLQWFGFGHVMTRDEIERGPDGSRVGVTYRCTVTKSMADGRTVTVATCEGYAGYDEDRFFATAEDARAKAERKERANASRYQRAANPSKWESITEDYKAPWNSVIKMAQKRALVGAALQATSASTLFTQDVEDNADHGVNPGAAIGEAARGVIADLSAEARSALDAWYKGKRWPDPGSWDAGQWCEALVHAGRLSVASEVVAAPERRPPPPEPGNDAESAVVTAEVVTVPADDPVLGAWALKIDEISSEDDGLKVLSELEDDEERDLIDRRKVNAIRSAIAAKVESLSGHRPKRRSGPPAEERGAVTVPTGSGDDGEWVQHFITRVADAQHADSLNGLQRQIGNAVQAKKITPAKAAELSTAIRERRTQLQGASA